MEGGVDTVTTEQSEGGTEKLPANHVQVNIILNMHGMLQYSFSLEKKCARGRSVELTNLLGSVPEIFRVTAHTRIKSL